MKFRTLPPLSLAAMPLIAFACALSLSGCGKGGSATGDDSLKGPATVEQAARVLDLSTFPLLPGAEPPTHRDVAELSYRAPGTAKEAFEFYRKQLGAQKWKETKDSSLTDQSASGVFTRGGFVLSVAAYPGSEGGKLTVYLRNLGNINLSKLPRPGATKAVYAGDSAAMCVTDASVNAAKAECRKLLLADGWQPYGAAGDSEWFKQNAVRLTATVSSAPAQGNRTMISYSSELLSADLPAPENAEEVRYAETTKELSFDTAVSKDDVVNYYKTTLGKTGWQPTLEKTVEIDERPTMIFRNRAKDMLTLSFSGLREGKLPVSLTHQSASEIAELEAELKKREPEIRAKIAAQRKEEEARDAAAHQPLPRIGINLPNDIEGAEVDKDSIKFNVGKGKARGVVQQWRQKFAGDGWKEDLASLDAMAGAVSLSKEKQSLTIHYTDTGFTPAEVNISAMGAEFEVQK